MKIPVLFLLLAVSLASIARAEGMSSESSTQADPGALRHVPLQAVQDLLEKDDTSCAELRQARRRLDIKLDPKDPDRASLPSLKYRLGERLAAKKCPFEQSETRLSSCELFHRLSVLVDGERMMEEEGQERPRLPYLEKELARIAIPCLRTLELDSAEARQVEQRLTIALSSAIPVHDLIRLLGKKDLDPKEVAKVVDLVFQIARSRSALERLAKLLSESNIGLSKEDALKLLYATSRLYERTGGDTEKMRFRLEIAERLTDPERREELVRILDSIGRRHSKLAEETQRAGREVKSMTSDPNAVVEKVLNAIESLVPHQTQLEAAEAAALIAAEASSSTIVFHRAEEVRRAEEKCGDVDRFLRGLAQTIHPKYGPDSGMRGFTEIAAGDAEELRDKIPVLLEKGPESLSHLCKKYRDLCTMPVLLGVYFVQFDLSKDGSSIVASVDWWIRPNEAMGQSNPDMATVRPRQGSVRPRSSFPLCGPIEHATDAGVAAAQLALSQLVVLKGNIVVDLRPPGSPGPSGSSAWYALAFAGAPFLADERASTTAKLVPSLVDASLLAGGIVSVGLSVKYRNDYATGRVDSLGPANRAFNVALGFAGGLLLTRIVSGVVYWRAYP